MVEHDKAAIIGFVSLGGLALDAHRWDLFDRVSTHVLSEAGAIGSLNAVSEQ